MTGKERIEKVFSTAKTIKIMTHVVGGYPDLETCESLVLLMAEKGVDMVEVQLPFSDPLADGPVIVQANHHALRAGVKTGDVMNMIERLRGKVDMPLLIMSYINPLYAYGVESFVKKALSVGIDGFIIPDCPPEEPELGLPGLCKQNNLAFVPLIAPSTTPQRMVYVVRESVSPFVYAVLRLGVTGRKTELDAETIAYLKSIKEITGRYVAAGFGIREKAQLTALTGHAECGVVGSALLRVIDKAGEDGSDPLKAAAAFLDSLLS